MAVSDMVKVALIAGLAAGIPALVAQYVAWQSIHDVLNARLTAALEKIAQLERLLEREQKP